MSTIINIADFRNRQKQKQYEVELEERIAKLAFGQWESEEEQIRYMTDQAEKDLEEWEKLYPINDIAK